VNDDRNSTRQTIVDELLGRGWLQRVSWLETIDSTNSQARRLIELGGLALPALFVADRQTAGRGRSDHVWWSPEGCLMLTLVLPSELLPDNPNDWSQLALVCGVAVADAVEALAQTSSAQSCSVQASPQQSPSLCQLKWPNDLYVRGRKMAGILIESARLEGKSPGWLVGIGLNVNIDWGVAPPELAPRATCLTRETQRTQLPEVVLLELLEQLQRWLVGWRTSQLHWLDGWRDRCLLTGKVVQVRVGHARVGSDSSTTSVGRCAGLDHQGRLLVQSEHGMQALSVGEVIHWQ
jgi:BirA family biotin operon repressor/biotin-[acetyl-CoA-carboxylase] ligase